MKRNRRPSKPTLAILSALFAEPEADRYGYELMKTTGLKSGTLYPILMRLEARGILVAEWRAPARPGRPARHAYRLSEAGYPFAMAALEQAPKQKRPDTKEARA